jgi:hypothetical protein
MVSVRRTAPASWLPVLATVSRNGRVAPGRTGAPPSSVLARPMTGRPRVGVVTASQDCARPAAEAQARLPISVAPAGSGLATWTAKSRSTVVPAGRIETVSEQVEPAAPEGEQLQPGALPAGANAVRPGTVSVTMTFEAPWLPTFWRWSV